MKHHMFCYVGKYFLRDPKVMQESEQYITNKDISETAWNINFTVRIL
jgi:hypothetical protein